jgi:hypothetical protein
MFVVHQPAKEIIAELRDKFHGRAKLFSRTPEKDKGRRVPAFA